MHFHVRSVSILTTMTALLILICATFLFPAACATGDDDTSTGSGQADDDGDDDVNDDSDDDSDDDVDDDVDDDDDTTTTTTSTTTTTTTTTTSTSTTTTTTTTTTSTTTSTHHEFECDTIGYLNCEIAAQFTQGACSDDCSLPEIPGDPPPTDCEIYSCLYGTCYVEAQYAFVQCSWDNQCEGAYNPAYYECLALCYETRGQCRLNLDECSEWISCQSDYIACAALCPPL
jgi:hypothetical protein